MYTRETERLSYVPKLPESSALLQAPAALPFVRCPRLAYHAGHWSAYWLETRFSGDILGDFCYLEGNPRRAVWAIGTHTRM